MSALLCFLSGLLFAGGLIVSGMTMPANVAGFLDFAGDWKPALALVMAGAVGVYATLHRLVLGRRTPLFARAFDLPTRRDIDARLVAGAAAFGAGWGLSGLCPGPALVALGTCAPEAFVFTAAMAVGMYLQGLSRSERAPAGTSVGGCG